METVFHKPIALLVVALASVCGGRAEPRLVNGFAAVVNDRMITYEQVESEVRPRDIENARLELGRQPQALAQELARLRQDALDLLIERELILHEFETAGYKLPESVIEEQIKDRIRESYGDRARLVRTLQAQNTTLETYRRRVREEFIVSVMTARNISSAILISPYKIESYYQANQKEFTLKDRVRLRMISLWNRPDRQAEATRKLADRLHAQLTNGTAFAELATQYSDDPNRKQGGDRGWIDRDTGDLRADLVTAAFELTPKVPSGVIEKEEGCYLMLVDEYQPAHVQPLTEVRDRIEATLRQKERARLRQDWIKRLRAKSFVRLFPLR